MVVTDLGAQSEYGSDFRHSDPQKRDLGKLEGPSSRASRPFAEAWQFGGLVYKAQRL